MRLSGLPLLALLAGVGLLDPLDLVPLVLMPFTWGAITGVGLAVWAYEPRLLRRVGEAVALLGVVFYLVVGILAGEKLRDWLASFPEEVRVLSLRVFVGAHTRNPFGMLRRWMEADVGDIWGEAVAPEGVGLAVLALLWRASRRLEGHFRARHYEPAKDVAGVRRTPVGDRPLAWWAVKRVSEFSGRINLYLAVGFGLLYAGYLVAEPVWPAWMGRRIFQVCDSGGGPAMLAAALVVLAAVPAAFQYGLWDSSAQDRCRRLELLLLTRLGPHDYWGPRLRPHGVAGAGTSSSPWACGSPPGRAGGSRGRRPSRRPVRAHCWGGCTSPSASAPSRAGRGPTDSGCC